MEITKEDLQAILRTKNTNYIWRDGSWGTEYLTCRTCNAEKEKEDTEEFEHREGCQVKEDEETLARIEASL